MRTWILLRGLARERGHWGDFLPRLQATMPGDRFIALDVPGNGALNHQTSPLRVADMVASCRTQLAEMGLQPPFHLLGMSMGGMVAVGWMQAHPAEVAGGVLINTSLRPFSPLHQRLRPGAWWPLLCSLFAFSARGAERQILAITSNLPTRRRAVLDDWTALRRARPVSAANALRQLWAAARFRAPWQGPDLPLLVLCSRSDRLVDARCSAALALHWQCPLALHPLAGHDLVLDAGKWVAAEIASYLNAPCSGADDEGQRDSEDWQGLSTPRAVKP